MNRWMQKLVAMVLAALVAGCQAQAPTRDRPADAAEAALLQRIDAEIGSASCGRRDDCRTLPIGSRPCGGPTAWRAWSAGSSDGARLQAWAGELAELQRRRDEAEGRMSTCQVLPEPGVACQAGRCVLLPGAGATSR